MCTSGIELMCLAERESTSLPKCSTSPTCHLEGSLEKSNSDGIGAIKGCSWPFIHVGSGSGPWSFGVERHMAEDIHMELLLTFI